MAQTATVPVGGDAVEHAVQIETMLDNCRTPAHLWQGLGNLDEVETPETSTSFGFLVPLVSNLPPMDEFGSLEAVESWANTVVSAAVEVVQPSVRLERTGGNECMVMTGYVATADLARDMGDELRGFIEEGGFEDPDHPGYVRGRIRGRLVDAAVYNGTPPTLEITLPSPTLYELQPLQDLDREAPLCTHDIAAVDVAPAAGDTVDMAFTVTRTCSRTADMSATQFLVAVDADAGRFASAPMRIAVNTPDAPVEATVIVSGVTPGPARARLFATTGN